MYINAMMNMDVWDNDKCWYNKICKPCYRFVKIDMSSSDIKYKDVILCIYNGIIIKEMIKFTCDVMK